MKVKIQELGRSIRYNIFYTIYSSQTSSHDDHDGESLTYCLARVARLRPQLADCGYRTAFTVSKGEKFPNSVPM
jgi:hypothetical protein